MANKDSSPPVSAGVEALIERLRQDGVEAGRKEAEALLSEAETRARRIVETAEAEAKSTIEQARKEAENLRRAGEDALQVAARDTVLQLRSQMMNRFSEDVLRLVAERIDTEEMIGRMILEVCGRARQDAGIAEGEEIEVLLPRAVVPLEELRRDPEALREGLLTRFVLSETGSMLAKGLTLGVKDDESHGIRVRVKDKAVELDLTEQAIAAFILAHLQPRFRALLEGIVR